MTQVDTVYEYLQQNFAENEPIFLSQLEVPEMKDVIVRQQIKKLTEDGRLKRFDTGIYYLPKKSLFASGSSPSAFVLRSAIAASTFAFSSAET